MAGRGAAAGGASPAFRTQTASVANGVSSLSVTIPAAVVTGDYMLIAVNTETGTTIATPSGWTLVRNDQSVAGNYPNWTYIFTKFAVAGDTGGATTVPLTTSAGDYTTAVFVAYSGVDATTPINAQAATGSPSAGTTLTAPTVTTTVASCTVLRIFGAFNSTGAANSLTGPATVRRTANASQYDGVVISDQDQAAAGATGTSAATAGMASAWVAQTIALKAA